MKAEEVLYSKEINDEPHPRDTLDFCFNKKEKEDNYISMLLEPKECYLERTTICLVSKYPH